MPGMRHLLATCLPLVVAAPAVAAEMLLLQWTAEPGEEGRTLLLLDRARILAVDARQGRDFAQTVEVVLDANEKETRFGFRCKDAAATRRLVEALRSREPELAVDLTGQCVPEDD
jgi:hypothetical protein